MSVRNAIVVACLALVGCPGGGIREGFFPCNTARDCPTDWYCRADLHCWSTPDAADAGSDASVDAASIDAGIDAPATLDADGVDQGLADAGCVVAAESCNGVDDDCDGLVDEGLLVVGSAVSAIGDTTVVFGVIAPTTGGFVVAGHGDTGATGWIEIGNDGSPTTTLQTYPDYSAFFEATTHDDLVVTSAIGTNGSSFVTFDLASPGAPRSSFNVSPDHLAVGRYTTFDGTTTTGYVMLFESLGGPATLRRIRANVELSAGMLLSDDPLASDVGSSSAFSATTAAAEDLVAYATAAGGAELLAEPVADATGTSRVVGTIDSGDLGVWGIEIAVADPARPIAIDNPLAVVWSRSDGVRFAEVTDTAPFTMRMARVFPTGIGSGERRGSRSIALARLPGSSASLAHWAVALLTSDFATTPAFTLTAFEIQPGAIREMTVPDEAAADRRAIGLAISSGTIRVVEAGNGGGLVTRSIGCE